MKKSKLRTKSKPRAQAAMKPSSNEDENTSGFSQHQEKQMLGMMIMMMEMMKDNEMMSKMQEMMNNFSKKQ